jgi:hypothetical protein
MSDKIFVLGFNKDGHEITSQDYKILGEAALAAIAIPTETGKAALEMIPALKEEARYQTAVKELKAGTPLGYTNMGHPLSLAEYRAYPGRAIALTSLTEAGRIFSECEHKAAAEEWRKSPKNLYAEKE